MTSAAGTSAGAAAAGVGGGGVDGADRRIAADAVGVGASVLRAGAAPRGQKLQPSTATRPTTTAARTITHDRRDGVELWACGSVTSAGAVECSLGLTHASDGMPRRRAVSASITGSEDAGGRGVAGAGCAGGTGAVATMGTGAGAALSTTGVAGAAASVGVAGFTGTICMSGDFWKDPTNASN